MKAEQVKLEWTDGNSIRLLQNGADFFPALCAAIDAARFSVHLETYIFMLDRTGSRVLECLTAAARRGVKVRVVLDGFGSAMNVDAVRAGLLEAGAQCRIFRPEPRWFARLIPSRSRLRRLHRKVTIVDGRIAFIGGINVIDDYDDLDPTDGISAPRFDFAVQVEGPLVTDAAYAQDLLWVRLNWARLRRHPRDWSRMRLTKPHHAPVAPCGTLRAALVLRDNLRYRQTFERAYLYGITQARRDILIANAYFFPGRQFRRALAKAAARGVRVRLLLQGEPDMLVAQLAASMLYDYLIDAGVQIFEYCKRPLHAKVACVDDDWSTVGSSNLDPLSLALNLEANVVARDTGLNAALRASLERLIAEDCRPVQRGPASRRRLRRLWVGVVVFHFLRRFPAWAGALPAHKPRLRTIIDGSPGEGEAA